MKNEGTRRFHLGPFKRHVAFHILCLSCAALITHATAHASSVAAVFSDSWSFGVQSVQPVSAVAPRNSFMGLDYSSKAALFDVRMSQAIGYEAKANVARDYVRSSPHAGTPRLERMFGNFSQGGRVDFSDPGVLKQLKRIGVENRQVVSGASRELAYYQKLYNNPALFREVRMGTPVPTARGGVSDMDIRFVERASGRPVWVEIKNNRLLTLDARIQAQIERMGAFSGRKVLVCRGTVAPQVKDLATRNGVEIIEHVKSEHLIHTLARADIQAMKIGGGVSIAGGALLTGFGVYSAYARLDAADWLVDDYVRRGLTSDALLTGAGVTTMTRGAILWHQASSAAATSAKAGAAGAAQGAGTGASRGAASGAAAGGGGAVWTKALGAAGWFLIGAYAANEGYRVYVGDVDPRTGTVQLSGLGGAAALGFACAKGGAAIGTFVGGPVGTAIGGFVGGAIGGVGGYFGGRAAGDLGYEHFVFSNAEFAKRKQELLKASLE